MRAGLGCQRAKTAFDLSNMGVAGKTKPICKRGPHPMSKLVTIFGGSGFVGRYITQRLAKAGWRIRVAVRSPEEALFVRTYGVVGQVEPIFCNIRDDDSVRVPRKGGRGGRTALAFWQSAARIPLTRFRPRRRAASRGSRRSVASRAWCRFPRSGQIATRPATTPNQSDRRSQYPGAYAGRRDPAPVHCVRARG